MRFGFIRFVRPASRGLPLLAAGLVIATSSCNRSQPAAPAAANPPVESYVVQGVLEQIEFAARRVIVEHEEIPSYMPAMTMPFDVKDMQEVQPLKAGDPIEFKLMVTEDSSWIEGIRKIAATEIQLPESEPGPAGAAKVARLEEGDRLPDFDLIDSRKRPINRETFAGRPLILTFIFTRCPLPNFCPLMSRHFKELQQLHSGAQAAPPPVQLMSVSIDPEFDTPEVLAAYAAQHTQDVDQWRFATGASEQIQNLAQAFAVSVQPEKGTINHGLATALIDAGGTVRKIWRGNGWTPAEVNEALRELSPQPSVSANP